MSLKTELMRDVRVAVSPRAQPVWFRVVKWVAAIGVSVVLWRTRYFWWWLGGAVALSLSLHMLWRWKTNGWRQPWAGWDDVGAAESRSPSD